MRKFLAPCWPRVTAESRVAEERAQPVNVTNIRQQQQVLFNWPNISTKQGTLSLNWPQCLMPPMTAVRILREFPEGGLLTPWTHMKAKTMTHVISDVSWMGWMDFFYLNFILTSRLVMNWASVSFALWHKAVTKLVGTFLWLRCINRGPFGGWGGMSHRSGLFRVCGNGWIE